MLVGGWVAALAAIGAVWQAGRYAGISPWWAGPETNPRNAIITIFPFLLGFVTLVLAHRNHRFACWAGIFAALTTAGIGLVDLSRFTGLGVSQLCIAGFSMMVTLAALSGRVGD